MLVGQSHFSSFDINSKVCAVKLQLITQIGTNIVACQRNTSFPNILFSYTQIGWHSSQVTSPNHHLDHKLTDWLVQALLSSEKGDLIARLNQKTHCWIFEQNIFLWGKRLMSRSQFEEHFLVQSYCISQRMCHPSPHPNRSRYCIELYCNVPGNIRITTAVP